METARKVTGHPIPAEGRTTSSRRSIYVDLPVQKQEGSVRMESAICRLETIIGFAWKWQKVIKWISRMCEGEVMLINEYINGLWRMD